MHDWRRDNIVILFFTLVSMLHPISAIICGRSKYVRCTACEEEDRKEESVQQTVRFSVTQTFQITQVKLHAAILFFFFCPRYPSKIHIILIPVFQTPPCICFLRFSYPLFYHLISIRFLYFFPFSRAFHSSVSNKPSDQITALILSRGQRPKFGRPALASIPQQYIILQANSHRHRHLLPCGLPPPAERVLCRGSASTFPPLQRPPPAIEPSALLI
jgi:hypothetical protein